METDLKKIADLARERWADNWHFLAYLQQHAVSESVDAQVHRLNDEVSAGIDCTQCANCCKQCSPHLTANDRSRLATRLQLPEAELIAGYLEADEFGEHVFRDSPCRLLQANRCRVYEDRPEDCRSYPHLHESEFVKFAEATIENYGVCPIVFNVYERLKALYPPPQEKSP